VQLADFAALSTAGRTAVRSGTSALSEGFGVLPENRGVLGSSPGLAIGRKPLQLSSSCFLSSIGGHLDLGLFGGRGAMAAESTRQ